MSEALNIHNEENLGVPQIKSEIEQIVLRVVGQERQGVLTEQDIERANSFHKEVRDVFGYEPFESNESGTLVVTHMRHARPETFIYPMQEVMHVFGIIPKPNSIDEPSITRVAHGEKLGDEETVLTRVNNIPVFNWKRADIANSPEVVHYLKMIKEELGWDWGKKRGFVINDNGGYLASSLDMVRDIMGDYFYGVVEDTNNGIDKYKTLDSLPCPVFSVARSPLKAGENYLVGQDIEYATKQILEQSGKYAPGSNILTIGYGPIGSSIAQAAQRSEMNVTVYDIDATKRKEASFHYSTTNDIASSLSEADVIFSATGNKGLQKEHFPLIKNGAEIALATSGDDELDENGLRELYTLTPLEGDQYRVLCKSKVDDHYFYLTNGLKTINFTVQSGIGTAILPLQAEIIRATEQLNAKEGNFPHDIIELPDEDRLVIARVFAKHFGQDSMAEEEYHENEEKIKEYALRYRRNSS